MGLLRECLCQSGVLLTHKTYWKLIEFSRKMQQSLVAVQ